MKTLFFSNQADGGGSPPATGESAAAPAGQSGGQAAQPGTEPDYKTLYQTSLQKIANDQERFAGLQRTYQAAQDNLAPLTAKVSEYENTISALTQERDSYLGESTTAKSSVEKLSAELERKKLIMSKFPHLSVWESKGLLPEKSGADLEPSLVEFSNSLITISKDLQTAHVQGAAPEQPARDETVRTAEVVLKEAQMAALHGDGKAYQTLFDEYLKVSSKKKS